MAAFQLVVLADFAGTAPTERRLFPVDRDSFGRVLERLAPCVEPRLDWCAQLELRSWEELSPDGLVQRVPALAGLLEARNAVGDPERMQALLADAGIRLERASDEPDAETAPPAPPPGADAGDLLDSMLEDAPAAPARSRRHADPELDGLLAQIAEGTESVDFASQDRWRDAIDRELGARVRDLLHAPGFRSVEAAWTGLRELLRAGDTDEAVRVSILPLTRAQLLDPSSSALLQRVLHAERDATPGAPGVELIIADYGFGDSEAEIATLERLGSLARLCAAPLLTGAAPELADLDAPASPALAELAASGGVDRVGLCCPRVLLRLPYGREAAPVDRFAFEESPGEGTPVYTWGSAAPVIGRAAVRAVTAEGSLAGLPGFAAIEGLPFHVYRAGGEAHSQHPVEQLSTQPMLKELIGRGLLPLAAVVGSDEARLVSLRSLGGHSLIEP